VAVHSKKYSLPIEPTQGLKDFMEDSLTITGLQAEPSTGVKYGERDAVQTVVDPKNPLMD